MEVDTILARRALPPRLEPEEVLLLDQPDALHAEVGVEAMSAEAPPAVGAVALAMRSLAI